MMDFLLWTSFVGAVTLLVYTPGPSVLLVTANSLSYGLRRTIATILGDLAANSLQMIFAGLGLSTIIMSSKMLFDLIKWVGVLYLLIMGIRKMLEKEKTKRIQKSAGGSGFRNLFLEGFMMSAANPKAILFFAAFFPLFLKETEPFGQQIMILILTFLVLDGLALLTYATCANRLQIFLEGKSGLRSLNRIVGLLLILCGLLLSQIQST